MQHLIEQYGYFALFIGSILEGETVLIIAGFAAHRGYLDIFWVIVVAAIAGFIGDQFFFTLGRMRGPQIIARFPTIQLQAARAQKLVQRYNTGLIIGVRFMYGLRVAGPVFLGMSSVSHLRFGVFNLIGAFLWAGVVGGAGYAFGQAFEMMLQHARRYEEIAFATILAVGVVVWVYRRAKQMRDANRLKAGTGG